jgi:hypothetical protein
MKPIIPFAMSAAFSTQHMFLREKPDWQHFIGYGNAVNLGVFSDFFIVILGGGHLVSV